jgi:hypothetical protein
MVTLHVRDCAGNVVDYVSLNPIMITIVNGILCRLLREAAQHRQHCGHGGQFAFSDAAVSTVYCIPTSNVSQFVLVWITIRQAMHHTKHVSYLVW